MALGVWMRRALMVAGLLASACVMAAGPAVEPGEYVYILGGSASGTMTVKGNSFSITTIGGNCHTCAIEGTFHGRVGVDKDEGKCHIAVSGNKDALKLDSSATAEACRDFCGMRAMFDGDYRRAPAVCTDRQRQARIDQAHKQYGAKNYDAARATLRSLLSDCGIFMDWIERDKARSDLAVTEYHRGHSAQCLAALSETIAVKAQKDASLVLPPCDADNYAATGKAILHNQGLCSAPPKK